MSYLVMAAAMVVVQYVKSSVAQIDARLVLINAEYEQLPNKRDLQALRAHGDKIEAEYNKMKLLRTVTFGTVAVTLVGLGLLTLATWQITQHPINHWEKVVRYVVLVPMIVVPLSCIGLQSEGIQSVMLMVAAVIFTAHSIAALKIAQSTNNRDIAEQLEWTFQTTRWLIVILWSVALLAVFPNIPKSVLLMAIRIIGIGLVLSTAVHSATIWKLSTRLR